VADATDDIERMLTRSGVLADTVANLAASWKADPERNDGRFSIL